MSCSGRVSIDAQMAMVSIKAQMGVFISAKYAQNVQNCIITVNNEFTSKILGQDVSTCPLFGL